MFVFFSKWLLIKILSLEFTILLNMVEYKKCGNVNISVVKVLRGVIEVRYYANSVNRVNIRWYWLVQKSYNCFAMILKLFHYMPNWNYHLFIIFKTYVHWQKITQIMVISKNGKGPIHKTCMSKATSSFRVLDCSTTDITDPIIKVLGRFHFSTMGPYLAIMAVSKHA